MTKKTVLACAGVFVVLAMVLGCGKKGPATHEANRGAVKGLVTLDGKPVGGGSITFISAKDRMYRVTVFIKSDGSFNVGDAPLGDVLVAVETESARISNPKGYVAIPRKYANIKTSHLTATIAKGGLDAQGQKLSFDLKSK